MGSEGLLSSIGKGHSYFHVVCDVSGGGGVIIKELEEDWSGEVSKVLESKGYQGFVDEVVSGTAVNQSGDGVCREEEGGAEKGGVGGVRGEMCWEGVCGEYHCMKECGQGREDIGVWSTV
ncbi:hypothetical protein C0989_008888 [Termitomyces sp. Mn162]|nr:hypothetical protein C0989_008888 [Termitomyces sp. Mn162]